MFQCSIKHIFKHHIFVFLGKNKKQNNTKEEKKNSLSKAPLPGQKSWRLEVEDTSIFYFSAFEDFRQFWCILPIFCTCSDHELDKNREPKRFGMVKTVLKQQKYPQKVTYISALLVFEDIKKSHF